MSSGVSSESFQLLLTTLGNLVDEKRGLVRNHCRCTDLIVCAVCEARKVYRQATGQEFRVLLVDRSPKDAQRTGHFRAELYDVNMWTREEIYPTEDAISEQVFFALHQIDALKIYHGDSAEACAQKAMKDCQAYGWTLI